MQKPSVNSAFLFYTITIKLSVDLSAQFVD